MHVINHLFYVDDIKMYAYNESELQQLSKLVENISSDICMNFGIQKCKAVDIERGLVTHKEELHGRHPNMVQQQHVNMEKSCLWLPKGELYPKTEGFVVAIQNQVISTRNYKQYILKEALDSDKCRKCHQMSEKVDHITSGCPILASKQYIDRHDDVAKIIHSQLTLLYGLAPKIEPYQKYHPSPPLENGIFKLYYNNPVLTDKTHTTYYKSTKNLKTPKRGVDAMDKITRTKSVKRMMRDDYYKKIATDRFLLDDRY
ncbi:hypothetical protein ILUMI_12413 [Ignelater luminosus]|uniref:Reverse transcriptase domain-containing protein n=1 Tax=Ignelater luminosus TaxID=2038154 RepID=A0A8K0GCZ3_IGNLU|nr:hypothetical protein ILUMI_12413 [Ignelater luminosus]